MSMITAQNNEVRSLKEKLAITEFQQQMIRAFTDGAVCTSALTNPAGQTFTIPTNGDPASFRLPQNILPAGIGAGAGALARAGEVLSPMANSVVVASTQPFHVANIRPLSANTFIGSLVVDLDQSKLFRALAPPSVSVTLTTTGAGTTKTVVGCGSSSGDSGEFCGLVLIQNASNITSGLSGCGLSAHAIIQNLPCKGQLIFNGSHIPQCPTGYSYTLISTYGTPPPDGTGVNCSYTCIKQ